MTEQLIPCSRSKSITLRASITKPVLNNNTFICLCILFAMPSKVRKKPKNLKINRKGRNKLKKSLKTEDLRLYWKTWQVCINRSDHCTAVTSLVSECIFTDKNDHEPFVPTGIILPGSHSGVA